MRLQSELTDKVALLVVFDRLFEALDRLKALKSIPTYVARTRVHTCEASSSGCVASPAPKSAMGYVDALRPNAWAQVL